MVFASLPFIFFILPLFLVLDFLSKKWNVIRNLALILISLFFYIFDGGTHSLKVLLAYGFLNFFFGYALEAAKRKNYTLKIIALVFFVSINILALVFYKYSYWLVSLLHDGGIAENLHAKQQVLPLGISFFTFHAVSYLIDISRGELNGRSNVINFLTYFFMFPHLIAGPIVRYKQVKDDLSSRQLDSNLFT